MTATRNQEHTEGHKSMSIQSIDARASQEAPVRLNYAENGSSGVLAGQFRRSSRFDESEAGRRRIALAIARAKQGDREALRFLYVEYADNVYGYVASIVKDEHEAEDITQLVFAKLMRVLPKYEQRAGPVHVVAAAPGAQRGARPSPASAAHAGRGSAQP